MDNIYIYIERGCIYTHTNKQIFNKKSSAKLSNVGLLPSKVIKVVGSILGLSRWSL